ncbi:unnamed protein product, partial [Mesorhabditis belari]|uniref:EGF-like domain-containing protein n=1 Tax=Mesorhabditis belari TaxID=2138241 RepID=A0AAF3FLC6_9BILA
MKSYLFLSLILLLMNEVESAPEKIVKRDEETNEIDALIGEVEAAASTVSSMSNQVKERLNQLKAEALREANHTANSIVSRSCTAADCNERGSCLGTLENYVCFCQIGYSGKFCEDAVCDSNRDCNGRGLCLGTVNHLTCLCNLGFTGSRCETLIAKIS